MKKLTREEEVALEVMIAVTFAYVLEAYRPALEYLNSIQEVKHDKEIH